MENRIIDADNELHTKVTDKRRDFSKPQPEYHTSLAETLASQDEADDKRTLEQRIKDCFVAPPPGRFVIELERFKNMYQRIHIPDTAKRVGTTGIVLRIGPGVQILKPGDRIVFGLWTGTKIEFKGKAKYRVLADNEWLGIIEDPTAEVEKVEA